MKKGDNKISRRKVSGKNVSNKKNTIKKIDEKKSFNKRLIPFLIIGILVLLGILYLIFFKTASTGGDDLVNFTFVRNNTGVIDNSSENISSNVSVNPINTIPGGSSGGSKHKTPLIDPYENKINVSDSDWYELNGLIYTNDFWVKGTCIDKDNKNGLDDNCQGAILNEYYLSQETCLIETIDCDSFKDYFPDLSVQTGCYDGACTFKIGGYNLTEPGYSYYGETIYWDECIDGDILKEYYVNDQGHPLSVNISCSNIYGDNSYCDSGACVLAEIEEPSIETYSAFDSDGLNYFNRGFCRDEDGADYDSCSGDLLIEYQVNSENKSQCVGVETICPYGACLFGECIPNDFDYYSESPYETASYCSDSTGNYSDSCIACVRGSTITYCVEEWFIDVDSCNSEMKDCREVLGEYARCSEGKCLIGRV